MQMTPEQCRMARAALGLSIADLADAAEVRAMTVSGFERGSDSRRSTVERLQAELEVRGAVFIAAGEASIAGGAGVRLKG
jgi:transcriptional regulator with XRE-family HTH domain